MAKLINECIDSGFMLQEMASWYAFCDGCAEMMDIDDNDVLMLIEGGWITNEDGQFCSPECYTVYVGVTTND